VRYSRDFDDVFGIVNLALREPRAFGGRLLDNMVIVIAWLALTDSLLQLLKGLRFVASVLVSRKRT
jgi:hypothetical protein